MIGERGPQGKRHWPRYNKRGCWAGDAMHVCAVCYCRLVRHRLRHRYRVWRRSA